MVDAVQHPPAVKVGGRRLSITARHPPKVHLAGDAPTSPTSPEITDYPRPAPPAHFQDSSVSTHEESAPDPSHAPHKEDEILPPKREKKHTPPHAPPPAHDIKETAHWKAETTRPTREHAGKVGAGAGVRIAQPAGKTLGL
ncbi:hypothetical protein BDQ12DRAFT_353883 [Crucibulum laeve]|uniref:Uncharacterized protein n=1 Tax=Crucibulum laeve TaxID=68775 RepID=A0A5C3ME55_9AGAR|nr:hypothetical protein BDQ12DRAFT_353883 [Crucibulum laeve]